MGEHRPQWLFNLLPQVLYIFSNNDPSWHLLRNSFRSDQSSRKCQRQPHAFNCHFCDHRHCECHPRRYLSFEVVIIKFLTIYEKDYTATYREASLAVKSILAQMVNSIVIPVITAYEIKKNVYSTSGLVDNVFMLGISMTIVPPIMVFVDPYNLFMKLMRCIKSRPGTL